jgi:LuxR family maltose regulon positive regulatory protein
LARAADARSFVEDFSGTDRDIADYLLSKVLASTSDEVRYFMVQTSSLSRLTGELCHAVTGRPGGTETLTRLEFDNEFVFPLDRDRR